MLPPSSALDLESAQSCLIHTRAGCTNNGTRLPRNRKCVCGRVCVAAPGTGARGYAPDALSVCAQAAKAAAKEVRDARL